ncbi:MAG TPA: hypothetical protein VF131_07265 [Blastocatellia bacterium]|nr:hypothetical protein [Blastocatellia bacterium]
MRSQLRLLTSLVLLLLAVACRPAYTNSGQEIKQDSANVSAPPHTNNIIDAAESVEELSNRLQQHLIKQDFAALEKIARQLRGTRARFPGGDWKLYRFYRALALPEGGSAAPEQTWKQRMEQLSKWIDMHPYSVTARTALGEALTGYAWKARGDGYADTVTKEGWRLFKARLIQAELVMYEAGKLAEKCPHSYCVRQDIALGQGWELTRYEQLFEEATELEPSYIHFYSNKGRYLMPRWFGEEGDWERFADETASRFGGKEGSMLYSHIAWQISKNYRGADFFNETKASWPRIRQGFIDREELYGASNRILNAFCKLAGYAGDRILARSLFVRIGDNCDQEIWKEKKYFDGHKAWAFK